MFIGYARVSTNDQNPDLQLDALRSAGCLKLFVETASGAAFDRPQLMAAIDAARPGDVIAVWKLDRLGRSLLQMIETVHTLADRGIGFVSLTESIDTTTSTGRFVLHVFAAIAEFERAMILERTLAGLHAARARGRIGGRPRKLGADELAVGRKLLSESRDSVEQIANRLGVSKSTFYKYFPRARAVTSKSGDEVPPPPPYP